MFLPIKLEPFDTAFGGKAMEILPPYDQIPNEFKGFDTNNPWVKWQEDWFFYGLKCYPEPKEGIDLDLAMQNLQCAQRSFEPKHEHKSAGVAYLGSLWFNSPEGEIVKKRGKK